MDRSAAYATCHIAKNLVAVGVYSEILVQVSYAIGVARPTNIYVNTLCSAKVEMSDSQIAAAIEKRIKLRNPIYTDTAAYGHMGRTSEVKTVKLTYGSGEKIRKEVENFTWEKLDMVEKVKTAFGLN